MKILAILGYCIGAWIVIQLIALPIKYLMYYVSFRKLKIGDYICVSKMYDTDQQGFLPCNTAKIVNIVYNKHGGIDYVETDNNDKIDFKQYNNILKY